MIYIKNINVVNFLVILLVYLILATGKVMPYEENFGIYHIAAGGGNLFLALILVIINGKIRRGVLESFVIMVPLFVWMSLSLLHSENIAYGIGKIEGAVFVAVIVSGLIYYIVSREGLGYFIRGLIIVSLMVLCATIIQRKLQGLEGRDGIFLINGPIVFGWIMGFNSLLCMWEYLKSKKRTYIFLQLIFFGAVLWSESKGPIIAVIFCSLLLFLNSNKKSSIIKNTFKIIFLLIALTLLYSNVIDYLESVESRLSGIARLLNNQLSEQDEGSFGIRFSGLKESISIWGDNLFFGVGLGNWMLYSNIPDLKYPHNFIAETLSEQGVFGAIFVFGTMFYLFWKVQANFKILMIYFFICLSFSGDASYWRLIFFLPLSVVVLKKLSKVPL